MRKHNGLMEQFRAKYNFAENYNSVPLVENVQCSSGKKCYKSFNDANRVIKNVQRHRSGEIHQSPYFCEECGCFHIRTNGKDKIQKIKTPPIKKKEPVRLNIDCSMPAYHRNIIGSLHDKTKDKITFEPTHYALESLLSEETLEQLGLKEKKES